MENFKDPSISAGHLPRLDGLRGLAILLVLGLHVFSFPDQPRLANFLSLFADAGWLGVDLFFVLSGFLITRILVRSRENENYFRNFYMRRVLRIFPLYFAYLGAYFVFVIWLKVVKFDASRTADATLEFPWVALYGTNFLIFKRGAFITASLNHLWSLAVEEHFYLFWPALVFWTTEKRLKWVCGGGILASIFLRISLQLSGSTSFAIHTFTFSRLDGFFVGALLVLWLREESSARLLRLYAGKLAVALGALFVCAGIWQSGLRWGDTWMQSFGYSLVAIFCGSLIACSLGAEPRRLLSRTFDSGVLRFFGKYSYGIYVLHFPVQIALERIAKTSVWAESFGWLGASVLHAFCVLALTLPIVLASWHLWEKRFLDWKKYFVEAGDSEKTAQEAILRAS